MAEREPHLTGAKALADLYEAKAVAELGDADALLRSPARGWSGAAQAAVALVTGSPFPAEGAGVGALGDAVGQAVGKAVAALGVDPTDVFVICSRPLADTSAELTARRLGLALEAVDPGLVLALDDRAAGDLAVAFGTGALRPGGAARVRGRVVGSVGDFAGSLGEPSAKAAVWAAMRSVAAEAGLKTKGRQKAPQGISSVPDSGKG